MPSVHLEDGEEENVIIETRYRDVDSAEIYKFHPKMPRNDEPYWKDMRGRTIKIVSPPIPIEDMDDAQKTCGERWYRVVKGHPNDGYVWHVCPHIAEIGD